jgi:tRNA pseudouridine65 synthase
MRPSFAEASEGKPVEGRPDEPIEVLLQDEHLVAVCKPGGLLVHRTPEASREKRFLLQRVRDQLGGDWLYPVHRLDRAASGIVVFATSSEGAAALQSSMAAEGTLKRYQALAVGRVPEAWVIDRLLTNKKTRRKQTSRTEFERLREIPVGPDHFLSLVRARLRTGRRHQIRRHLAGEAHFILGDTNYGKGRINRFYREEFDLPRLFLHADRLQLAHPATGEPLTIQAPLPADLHEFLLKISAPAS